MGNQNRIIFIPMRLKNILNESTTSDIIKDLDKVKNDLLKKVDVLVAKKKKLYSDVDIESPMSSDEKKLDKDIADLFSQINTLVLQKRSLKKESINELTHNEKSIRDGNPNNVYYAFYKGQFEAIYSAMGPSGLFDMYWDKFKVRRQAGSKFKLNPEFVFISKKDYDSSTSNRYAKLKPHVDKLWDTLKNESVNEGKYYIGYNKGRGQGTGVFKDVFPTYKDAKKELEKIEKQRGGSYNQIAYYVADEKGNFVRESVNEAAMNPVKKVVNAILKKNGVTAMKTTSTSVKGFHNIQNGGYRYDSDYFLSFYNVPQNIIDKVGAEMEKAGVRGVDVRKGIISADFTKTGLKESVNEGRAIKSIQNDLDKTVVAIESEIASYKATKGTPQEKKHIDNLKKLHPIKKKLQSELDMVVSGLYRDAELKIENLISIKEATIKVGGNGKTINGYDVDYFKTARGVYANIEIPSQNPTFDDDTQIKGFGKDEKEAFNDLKKEFEKYLKQKR
jgi:hypothetical protein